MAQVPLFKLCPSKYKIKLENKLDTSLTNDYEIISNSSDDQSSDSISNNNNNNTKTTRTSPAQTKITTTPNSTCRHASQLFEICVDCYQMMDGIIVSANETDLVLGQNGADRQQHRSPLMVNPLACNNKQMLQSATGREFATMAQLNQPPKQHLLVSDSSSSLSPSPSSVKSNDEIVTMLSLKDVNVIDVNDKNPLQLVSLVDLDLHSSTLSPVFTKTLQAQHSSTPTPVMATTIKHEQQQQQLNAMMIPSDTINLTPLTVECINPHSKLMRESLTLNLQPVYVNDKS
jgi:hypothetical protein